MNNSGLTRYQSAPSSFFSSLQECEEFFNRPTSPETERIFAGFFANSDSNIPKQDSPVRNEEQIPQQAQSLTPNDAVLNQQQGNYGSVSQGYFQAQPEEFPGADYRVAGAGRQPLVKSGGSSSNLVRHSSSPAGLFNNINVEMENGYGVMRGMGVKREAGYTSGGRMRPITEIGNKNMGENSSDNVVFDESGNDYVRGYCWDDHANANSVMSKRLTDDDRTLSGLNSSETQNIESGIPAPARLAHHLSLPKTAAEMSAIEKFLQDSVPCKIRAKRGFATHPRSIAERVRRTKISERMRKLQDLVPNMDKQTNTSDMLDLAVEYIKDLQREVKTLSESRANCTCDIKEEK